MEDILVKRQDNKTRNVPHYQLTQLTHLSSSGVAPSPPDSEADGDVPERNCAHRDLLFESLVQCP